MRLPAEPLLLATRSADKAREIREILRAFTTVELVTLEETGLTTEPEEDDVEIFNTFLDNAMAKAAYFARRTGMSVIADDSGICVAALGGAPGVRSRRFAADLSVERTDTAPGGSDEDAANNSLLLARLAHVPREDRSAHYACAAALLTRHGQQFVAIGTCAGSILTEPRGNHGFGYDPLFLDPASGRSFAEIDPAVKNSRSHRARAFRALASVL